MARVTDSEVPARAGVAAAGAAGRGRRKAELDAHRRDLDQRCGLLWGTGSMRDTEPLAHAAPLEVAAALTQDSEVPGPALARDGARLAAFHGPCQLSCTAPNAHRLGSSGGVAPASSRSSTVGRLRPYPSPSPWGPAGRLGRLGRHGPGTKCRSFCQCADLKMRSGRPYVGPLGAGARRDASGSVVRVGPAQ
jgi:hypothetical protein